MKTLLLAMFLSVLGISNSAIAHDGPEPDGHLMFANGAIHAHLFWEAGPIDNGESIMRVEFKSGTEHTPLEIPSRVSVALKMDMEGMHHGSAPTAIQRVLDAQGQVLPGVYRVSNMYFVMSGPWEVQVTLTNADGSFDTQVLKLDVPSSGGGIHHM